MPAIADVQVAPESVLRRPPRPWVAASNTAGCAGETAIDQTGRSGDPGCWAPVDVQRASAAETATTVASNPAASVMGVSSGMRRESVTWVPGKRSKDSRRSSDLPRGFGRSVHVLAKFARSSHTMLEARQLWRALHAVPQLLLVQPEQLGYDLAYALALLPLVIAGIVFFLQDALLLFAISFLAGIVCLLALQLARLTFGLPAWIGFKATHPLVASVLIACFFPPRTPAWVAATMVIVFIVIDTFLWPQLQRVMLHPALIVFGILFLIQRQLGFGYVNPFDGRHLDDPLTLWYKLQLVVDPVKLYVGNVSGPIGVTSAGAVLIGVTYLWYTRKISLGVVTGFLCGVAVLALVIRSDLGFQLASGPSLYLAGYIAADRRRVIIPERFTFAFGLAAGMATMILRWYGEGQQAAWQGLLLVGVVATIVLRVQDFLHGRVRMPSRTAPMRTLTVESGEPPDPQRLWAPVREEARAPAMAMSPGATGHRR